MYWFEVGFYGGLIISLVLLFSLISIKVRTSLSVLFNNTFFGESIRRIDEPNESDTNDENVVMKFLAIVATVIITFAISLIIFLITWLLSYIIVVIFIVCLILLITTNEKKKVK